MSGATVDHQVWGDARFDDLARRGGYSRYEAVGRMAHLWDWCIELCSYVASRVVVCRYLGPAGDEHILAADLGELQDDGTIRIKGTKGRIEWKRKLRESSKSGGAATKAKWQAKRQAEAGLSSHTEKLTEGQLASQSKASWLAEPGPDHRPIEGPSSPSPSSSSDSLSFTRTPDPVGWAAPLLDHAVRRLDAARARLDPSARPIGSWLNLGDSDRKKLQDRLRAIESGERMGTLDHCLDVVIRLAEIKGNVGYLRVGMLAGDASWPRWCASTPAAIEAEERPRAPPQQAPRGGRHTAADELAALASNPHAFKPGA